MLLAQGDLAGALNAYRDGMGIRERLAAHDPGNATWQRDLASSHERIGAVLQAQGQKAGAIAAFERALNIYRAAQQRQPNDLESRLFSVVPLCQLGRLKEGEGRADLQTALGILEPLAVAGRLDQDRCAWIEEIRRDIAAITC